MNKKSSRAFVYSNDLREINILRIKLKFSNQQELIHDMIKLYKKNKVVE